MATSSLYALYLRHPVISTDTRSIQPGSIFFALKGEHFDGNAFAKNAVAAGAAYAIVSDTTITGENIIHVEDTLASLQQLAKEHRNHLKIPVIGITGSNGKTTTKELTATVLSGKYKVYATQGNLNNHIGVPLTILGIPSGTEILICEMGANHIGEIKELCSISQPTHGVITNIGRAHLEGFGSFEGVKKAKGELFDFLREHDGFAFVNADDASLLEISAGIQQKTTYAIKDDSRADIHFQLMHNPNGVGFSIVNRSNQQIISSTLFGQYNAINMVAAYTIGRHFNVDEHIISGRLSSFVSKSNRSELVSWKGCTVVKDAYNANPTSMELAITAFAAQYPEGLVVLGDMKELGTETAHAHQLILSQVKQNRFEKIWLVGTAFMEAAEEMQIEDERIKVVPSVDEVKQQWNWTACKGKALLLKGSRSMRLERLLE